jgi:signal transduction histidine kinase/ligand-binding sensor domain-containing protein
VRTRAACLLLCSLAAPAAALDPATRLSQYGQDLWQVEQGLPQNSVQSILQAREGYLWLGTQEGLARFDGVRFTLFDRANTPEIRHNSIQALLEARDGSVWIATYVGGLTRLKDGRFTVYGTRDGLPDDQVLCLHEDGQGRLWIGTRGGLASFDGRAFTVYGTAEGLLDPRVWAVTQDEGGALWIGTDGGLNRLEGGRMTALTARDGLPAAPVHAVLADRRRGGLWVGTYGGLVRMDGGRVSGVYTAREGLVNDLVWTLLQDRTGALWIGTSDGVSRFADGRFESLTPREGVPNGHVRALAEDREGSLWIGTNGGGLLRLRDGRFTRITERDGLPDAIVRTILQDRTGATWIGTNRGLARVQSGRLSNVGPARGFPAAPVFSLHQDQGGALWVGTYGAGLWRWQDGRFRSWRATDGLSSDIVRAIHRDRAGDLWVGTEAGLNRQGRDGRFTVYGEKNGLPSDQVFAILEDRRGALWFGTGGGLVRWSDGRFTAWGPSDGLRSTVVFALHEDADGTLWFGTDGGGLHRLRDGRVTAVGVKEGLFDDLVVRILDDGQGTLWMSSNRGVFSVGKRELDELAAGRIARVRSASYGTADGMPSAECHGGSQPAGWRTTDGRLWFPTLRGVAILDPGRLSPNPVPPPVVVESVRVNHRPFQLGSGPLPPGSRDIELQYTGLSLLAPARVRFRYRLEGYEADWVDAGTRRVAFYGNLAPGAYRFQVTAANNDGVWNEEGAAVAFEVAPRLFQTKPFAAGVALLAALAVMGGYRARTRHLRRRQQELEALVEARTRDLREAQERAEQSRHRAEEASQAKTRFLANVSHELRTPLNTILGFVELLQRENGPGAAGRGHLAIVHRSGEHLLALINNVLSIAQIESGVTPVQATSFEPARLLEGLHEIFAERAAARGLRLRVEHAGLPACVRGDEAKLRQVLINLLGNAVKFTAEGGVTLRSEWRDGTGIFEVEDTGPGIPEDERERLFEPFAQGQAGLDSGGTGLGLAISRTYARLMGGELALVSTPGPGARFRLELPLPEGAAPSKPEAPLPLAPLSTGERPFRVLVVDDTAENRVLMARLHALVGLQVEEATDGREALERWQAGAPDLIWMDTRMPNLDGPAATREIRRREQGTGAHVPIIAVTAGVLDTHEDDLLAAGYDAVVPKPFRAETIFGLLRTHLERAGQNG